MMGECTSMGHWLTDNGRGNEVLREKPVTVPLEWLELERALRGQRQPPRPWEGHSNRDECWNFGRLKL